MFEKVNWNEGSHYGKVLHQWWKGLEKDHATRAILRRCSTLDDVILSSAYQRFYRYMLTCNWPEDASSYQNDKLAAIAGLLAHINSEDTKLLPVLMSELNGDKPMVSELRFRDLLKIESTDDLFQSLRRVLPLINKKANPYNLANDIFFWGDQVKKKWAYTYHWPSK